MQSTVIGFASKLVYYIGFPGTAPSLLSLLTASSLSAYRPSPPLPPPLHATDVTVDVPILKGMQSIQFFSLYLGLIMSIILTILFLLSCMLIYSLLMISIETRTFELGVHRMVCVTE
jgi:hypothetical protein